MWGFFIWSFCSNQSQFSKNCLKWESVLLLVIWFQGELMVMASSQHSNYLGCLRAMKTPGEFDRVLIISERFLMITFCIKMEEQNKAYILHISWALANKFSLHEGPHGCSNKKYLSTHRSSGLLRVKKQLHLCLALPKFHTSLHHVLLYKNILWNLLSLTHFCIINTHYL